MNEEKKFFDDETFRLQAEVLENFRRLKNSVKALGQHLDVDVTIAKQSLLLFNAAMIDVSDDIIRKTRAKHIVNDFLKSIGDTTEDTNDPK